tara:strand:+ start:4834 stop:5550 length:717 start_codon:yes stop_codon:yes gene_type:complete
MLVALVKAGLVVGFFMHLRYDNKFLSLIFFGSVVFMAIFFFFTMFDLTTRGVLNREEAQFALKNEKVRKQAESKKVSAHTETASALTLASTAAKKAFKPAVGVSSVFVAKVDRTFPKSAPALSKEILQLGHTEFQKNCASCHGAKGQGNGSLAPTLKIKPTNFASGNYRYGGTPKGLMRIINNGSPRYNMMAAWKNLLPEKTRWALVHYILQMNPKTRKQVGAKAAPATRKAAPAPRK